MINPDCMKGMDFVEKYINDFTRLENMGFEKTEIIKMLGRLQYVTDFVDTPEWLGSVEKLPKGYKWTDGTKYKEKGKKISPRGNYVFLNVENDLYIKGMMDKRYEKIIYEGGGAVACQELRDRRICVIRDWKKIKGQCVANAFAPDPFLENSIMDFWYRNGGRIDCFDWTLEDMAKALGIDPDWTLEEFAENIGENVETVSGIVNRIKQAGIT